MTNNNTKASSELNAIIVCGPPHGSGADSSRSLMLQKKV